MANAHDLLMAQRAAMMGGWVNPYQTSDNALVAMWDGEWNAGGGVHDATSGKVVDLVGGIGNMVLPSDKVIVSNGVRVDGKKAVNKTPPSALVEALKQGLTIEHCFTLGKSSSVVFSNYYSYFVSLGRNIYIAPYKLYDSTQNAYLTLNNSGRNYFNFPNGALGGDGGTLHLAITFNGSVAKAYCNGTSVKSVSVSMLTRSEVDTGPFACLYQDNAIIGETSHSYRIYDRALSDSEISQNYNRDIDRFVGS